MNQKANLIRNLCQDMADKIEKYNTSSMRHEVFRVLRGILDITDYMEKSPHVEDYVIQEFDMCVRKIWKYIEDDLSCSQEKLDSQIFSIKEWDSYSEERKHSIMAFIAVAVTRSKNLETYTKALESFDYETKEWLSVNCPFEDLREVFERGLKAKTEK